MKTSLKTNQSGFSLLELMVVITIIAILSTASFPVYQSVQGRARIMKDVAHQDQVVKACKIYAMDWDGAYPSFDTSAGTAGADFATSTEAFNELIRETSLGSEVIFYVKGNSEKSRPPNQDGELTPEECCLVYVSNQSDTTPARSPLVADEMEGPGTYGENHPWLSMRKAVVGYCGGQVVAERLSARTAGATVRGPAEGMTDIFQKAVVDESGKVSAGLLHVDPSYLLLPGSGG